MPWCELTPTAHKPLDHGQILLELIPPTLTAAMMSEEPGEASNKYTKVIKLSKSLYADDHEGIHFRNGILQKLVRIQMKIEFLM